MNRSRVLLSGLAAVVLIGPAVFAYQQPGWTGTPADTFRTRVINSGRSEAVPVSIQEVTLSTGGPGLRVSLDPAATVKLDPGTKVGLSADAVIRARLEPRNWEYKLVPVTASGNVEQFLNVEGAQGWEMVGVVPTATGSFIALKRQK